jgi:hypothetical protein
MVPISVPSAGTWDLTQMKPSSCLEPFGISMVTLEPLAVIQNLDSRNPDMLGSQISFGLSLSTCLHSRLRCSRSPDSFPKLWMLRRTESSERWIWRISFASDCLLIMHGLLSKVHELSIHVVTVSRLAGTIAVNSRSSVKCFLCAIIRSRVGSEDLTASSMCSDQYWLT